MDLVKKKEKGIGIKSILATHRTIIWIIYYIVDFGPTPRPPLV